MDLDVLHREVNRLKKFRDDMLVLITREGTQEAFDAMVAERRAQAAEEAADRAAGEAAAAKAAAEPTGEPGESSDDAGKPIAGAEKPAGSVSDEGKGIDPNAKPAAPGAPGENKPDPALSGASS